MSFPMTHLTIAYEIAKQNECIQNTGSYLIGALAPDSVHFRENYNSRMKEASHLWNNGPYWGLTTDTKGWRENIEAFVQTYQKVYNRDFVLGYATHVLTDWYNDVDTWTPFRTKVENASKNLGSSEYHQEARILDYRLYLKNSNQKAIWDYVKKGECITIPGIVDAQEMERMRQSILYEQFENREDIPDYVFQYLNEEIEEQFIVKNIKEISSYIQTV